ncbi:MAG: thioredoxin domain-containing protein [Myxococcales bacterium]|nr:thioredoxin domain-containing protein [Myxococcales bacterium]
MIRCGVCGAEQSGDAEVCWGCGAAIESAPPPASDRRDEGPAASAGPGPSPAASASPHPPFPAPRWIVAVAALLAGCAALLWVMLQFAIGPAPAAGGGSEAAVTAAAGDARSPDGRDVLAGPWGAPWGGGEGASAGADAKLDPDALPYRGSDDPLVAIVEFGDYECEFTRKVERTLARLLGRFGGDVRVVFVHNPLPIHDHARLAARAAEAARRQGRFGEMHERLLAAEGKVEEADVLRIARDLDLDVPRFRADLDGWAKDTVAGMAEFARKHGIRGTPHFVIGGRVVEGARPEEIFAKVIEAALEDARRRLADGKSRREVYGESLAFLAGG